MNPAYWQGHRVPGPKIHSDVRSGIWAADATCLDDLWEEAGGTNWSSSDGWGQRETNSYNCHGVTVEKVTDQTKERRKVVETVTMRATAISLPHNHLSGEIASFSRALGGCSWLVELDLSRNSLRGEALMGIGACRRLRVVRLSHNDLTGSIPESVCACGTLRELHLNDNALSGPLPARLGELAQLEVLELQYNGLSGELPASFSYLKALRVCNLQRNRLVGEVPAYLGFCSALRVMDLRENDLEGGLPTSLGLLSDGRGGGVLEQLLIDGNPRMALPETLRMFVDDAWQDREMGRVLTPTGKVLLYYDGDMIKAVRPVLRIQSRIRMRLGVRRLTERIRREKAAVASRAAAQQAKMAVLFANKAAHVAAKAHRGLLKELLREKRRRWNKIQEMEAKRTGAARADAAWFNSLSKEQQRAVRLARAKKWVAEMKQLQLERLQPVIRVLAPVVGSINRGLGKVGQTRAGRAVGAKADAVIESMMRASASAAGRLGALKVLGAKQAAGAEPSAHETLEEAPATSAAPPEPAPDVAAATAVQLDADHAAAQPEAEAGAEPEAEPEAEAGTAAAEDIGAESPYRGVML